jgi:hypothetical protein
MYAITPRFAPTSTEAQLAATGELARAYPDTFIQTHVSENQDEVRLGRRAVPARAQLPGRVRHYGLMRPRAMYGHCIWLDDTDFARMAETGSARAICPTSNLFLGSGLFDFARRQGRRAALAGTDVGGGTSFSMLQTMNEAYKVARLKGSYLPALRMFYLATLGAARSMQLEGTIGNFAPARGRFHRARPQGHAAAGAPHRAQQHARGAAVRAGPAGRRPRHPRHLRGRQAGASASGRCPVPLEQPRETFMQKDPEQQPVIGPGAWPAAAAGVAARPRRTPTKPPPRATTPPDRRRRAEDGRADHVLHPDAQGRRPAPPLLGRGLRRAYVDFLDKQGYCVNKQTYRIETDKAVVEAERAKPAWGAQLPGRRRRLRRRLHLPRAAAALVEQGFP